MENNTTTQDIRALFGFDEMSEDEQGTLLNDIGHVLMEGAVFRYMAECTGDEAATFERLISESADSEGGLATLTDKIPRFGEILAEEVHAFQSEAKRVLGT